MSRDVPVGVRVTRSSGKQLFQVGSDLGSLIEEIGLNTGLLVVSKISGFYSRSPAYRRLLLMYGDIHVV